MRPDLPPAIFSNRVAVQPMEGASRLIVTHFGDRICTRPYDNYRYIVAASSSKCGSDKFIGRVITVLEKDSCDLCLINHVGEPVRAKQQLIRTVKSTAQHVRCY